MKSIFKKIISFIIQKEASLVIAKYKPKIIAVTGNIGKTSTKDAIFSVISKELHVRKSEKSFNSDIGVPLTILGCENAWSDPIKWIINIFKGLELIIFKNNYPEWLVLEVGADRPGDIKNITKWLKPNIVVLTAFAKVPVHIEFFKDREELIKEKKYLSDAIKHNGVLIVNGDDVDAIKIKATSKNSTFTYGTDGSSNLHASDLNILYNEEKPIGMTFKANYLNDSVPVVINDSLGVQNVYSSLAAISIAIILKINFVKACEYLRNHETPRGRMRIIKGIKNSTLIDDTYNSSPKAVESALDTLKQINHTKRKIAVLGDMLELGKHSVEEHYSIGKMTSGILNILITVGIRARKIAEGALDSKMKETNIFQFDSSDEAGKFLQNFIKEGDMILVKGSQSIRTEKIVKEIMLEPETAKDLLVRQDEEWTKR